MKRALTVIMDNNTQMLLTDRQEKLINDAVKECLIYENFTIECEVSILIVSNNEIKNINKYFRKIDSITDVLSFPQLTFEEEEVCDKNGKGEILLGDIVISIEKAFEQAYEYGHSFEREIVFLTVHSMLHLLGYDHMDANEESIMFSKQEAILDNIGIKR